MVACRALAVLPLLAAFDAVLLALPPKWAGSRQARTQATTLAGKKVRSSARSWGRHSAVVTSSMAASGHPGSLRPPVDQHAATRTAAVRCARTTAVGMSNSLPASAPCPMSGAALCAAALMRLTVQARVEPPSSSTLRLGQERARVISPSPVILLQLLSARTRRWVAGRPTRGAARASGSWPDTYWAAMTPASTTGAHTYAAGPPSLSPSDRSMSSSLSLLPPAAPAS
mmetsp:Transcript_9780/g.24374  ORF Transcript_9780/g.24374 Transcript_9780/m.24374 type:complete len:228 (+) Transcript_9780:1330-2013(+)